MTSNKKEEILVPLDVPTKMKLRYKKNYSEITKKTGKLFLFAADQKIEHLNKDFFGPNIPKECNNPKHLFDIASKAKIGAFATHLGLISTYGNDYKNINFIIKLNSKTNFIPTSDQDPKSLFINTPEEAIQFKKDSKLKIAGFGYTIYLGSKYESEMLREARETINVAHQNGMIAILWIYPRGKAVKDELSIATISGAAGVGACLGADFIKVNPPKTDSSIDSAKLLLQASDAAGKSKLICSGGALKDEKILLQTIKEQIEFGNIKGCAIGRNIFQKSTKDAIKTCNAIASIVFDNQTVNQAMKILK